jgi:WD40 repeat protein
MGSILPCCLPFGNAGGFQILCCQGFEVKNYDVTLDALTLKPSDVCNVGVTSVSFSPNGKFLITSGSDKSARLLDFSTGNILQRPVSGMMVHRYGITKKENEFKILDILLADLTPCDLAMTAER